MPTSFVTKQATESAADISAAEPPQQPTIPAAIIFAIKAADVSTFSATISIAVISTVSNPFYDTVVSTDHEANDCSIYESIQTPNRYAYRCSECSSKPASFYIPHFMA